ncbi:MAG: PfkB family carbohydrate kinase [Chloroflexota bacterium]
MIAIIGIPVARSVHLGGGVEGTTARAANAAARAGATVQLVGKTGDDPAGDALLLALAAAGVGHVAVLRDAAHSTPIAQPTGAASEAEETALIDELLDDAAPAFEIVPVDAADRPSLEAADVELALRYLPDFRAIVVAEPLADGVVAVAAEAAAYGGAELVVVVAAGQTAPAAANALVLEAPRDDDEGAFATMLGELAAALDTGATAADAFREARDRVGVGRPAS